MHKIIIILLLSFGFVCGSSAQVALPDAVKDNIKARVDNGLHPAIVVGIIDAEGSLYYSYGVRSLKTKEPVDEHSVFEIGSVTKTFTGIILADMVIKGEVKLDDLLQNYLPADVKAPMRNGELIKLVHLSNHTSSLPRLPDNLKPTNVANPYADYSEKQLYDFLTNYTLTRDIGSQYEYSNYGVGLLGYVLSTKRKVTYEKLMTDVIAVPLDLKDTRITFTPNMKAHLAMGHNEGVEVANWDLPTLAGAGAIRSTAADMLKYVSANMGKEKSQLYPSMRLSQQNSRTQDSKPKVGLGWHIAGPEGAEIIWHNGGTGGYRSFIGFTRKGDKGVVVLTNSSIGVDDIGMHMLNPTVPLKSVKDLKEPIVNADVPEVVVDNNTLETYVGKYELAPGFILTVSRQDNQLKAQATGQPEFPVFPKAENIFFLKVVQAQLTFNKNEFGKIVSVTLDQAGQQITGKRLEK